VKTYGKLWLTVLPPLKPSALGPAVSQHLRVLKAAGLVSEDQEGARHIYRLDPRGIAAMRGWLDAHWSTALEAFKDFADGEGEAVR
jgi:DNA-binding PadR family transcriptional regulator